MNNLLIPIFTCCLATAPVIASTLSLKKPVAIMSKKAITTQTAASMQLAAGGQLDNRDDRVFIEGLWPFMRQEQQLLFLQGGWQRQQRNSQISLGMGWRYFPEAQWGVGYNLFYDQDMRQHQHRIGWGVEAWLHSMKLLVNGYLPANDWREARDLPEYQQRAARGYDITLRGYLPALPQLGASMRYTHYFGDAVAWGDREKRYKNPQQWRWGIDYTPVPLLTLAYYHHTGFSGQTKHRLGMELTYRFNLSLAQHLDPKQIVELYSAQGQRWSRVSRDQMALNYTKVTSPKLQPLLQPPPQQPPPQQPPPQQPPPQQPP
ncbi:MAG: inverse autotransporter beta domain-containing protein, partial [Candidatus Symbiodolus clandestinus]